MTLRVRGADGSDEKGDARAVFPDSTRGLSVCSVSVEKDDTYDT